MRRTICAAFFFGTIGWTSPVMAQLGSSTPYELQAAGTLEVYTGADYLVGSYGYPVDTTAFKVPLGLSAQFDRVRLEVAVPYLHIEGPGSVADGIVVPGSGIMTTRSGLGDVSAAVGWVLSRGGTSEPSLEVEGAIKLATAGEDLGTGNTDYFAQAKLYVPISAGFTLYGSAGYHWLGTYQVSSLGDGFTGTVGASLKVGDAAWFGATAAYRQEYLPNSDARIVVTPYLSWRMTERFRVTGYGMWGLTEVSPDFGVGLRLGF